MTYCFKLVSSYIAEKCGLIYPPMLLWLTTPHNRIDVVVAGNEEEDEDVDSVALYLGYYG
jgi:hypothetical protein